MYAWANRRCFPEALALGMGLLKQMGLEKPADVRADIAAGFERLAKWSESTQKLQDLTLREQLTLAPLVILALWIGLYPKPIFDVIRRPSEKIVQAVGGVVVETPALALQAPTGNAEPVAAAHP